MLLNWHWSSFARACRADQLPEYFICIKTYLLDRFCSKVMGVGSGERLSPSPVKSNEFYAEILLQWLQRTAGRSARGVQN